MYEPQEDSEMLKEALTKFLEKKPQSICSDIGTGTGIQGTTMMPYCKKVIFSDINPEVITYIKNTIKKENKNKVEVIQSDLFKNFDFKLRNKIDIIAFNPPYLPREENEEDDLELTSGTKGINITIRFIKESKQFLSKQGRLFFVVSSHSNIKEINNELKQQNYEYKIINKKHFFFEDIMIYEAWLNEKNE